MQNPREMIAWRIFSEMIRSSAQKSELQAKSRSFRAEVRVTAGETPSEQNRPENQGRTNQAFAKPCLFLSDTLHFRHFRRFRGSEERSPCFQWVECKFVIFAVFVKTAPLGNASLFTKFLFTIFVTLNPPPSQPAK